MSSWGILDARFAPAFDYKPTNIPTGSESGPTAYKDQSNENWYVCGHLRDVYDVPDSIAILAWFVDQASSNCNEADLMWEIVGGPRYRYEWRDNRLTKIRGVLD
jgi:hypothetical protein